MTPEPWTFEDLTVDQEDTWTVVDPNTARIVAIFYDQNEAHAYLRWRNADQARRRAEKLDLDDDGRC